MSSDPRGVDAPWRPARECALWLCVAWLVVQTRALGLALLVGGPGAAWHLGAPLAGHGGAVRCGAFTPDGRGVVTGGGEGDGQLRRHVDGIMDDGQWACESQCPQLRNGGRATRSAGVGGEHGPSGQGALIVPLHVGDDQLNFLF